MQPPTPGQVTAGEPQAQAGGAYSQSQSPWTPQEAGQTAPIQAEAQSQDDGFAQAGQAQAQAQENLNGQAQQEKQSLPSPAQPTGEQQTNPQQPGVSGPRFVQEQQPPVQQPPVQQPPAPAVPPSTGPQGDRPLPPSQPPFGMNARSLRGPNMTEFSSKTSLKALGASLGLGLAFALVGAAISLIFTNFALSAGLKDSILKGMPSDLAQGNGEMASPGFFQSLCFMLISGVSGSATMKLGLPDLPIQAGVEGSLQLPIGLAGLGLILGAAFGAYLLGRSSRIHFKWTGVVSAALVGLGSCIVFLILAAIFPISTTSTVGMAMLKTTTEATLNGATFKTALVSFLLAGTGSLIGYALARYTPDGGNVFKAAWIWLHRARGTARMVGETVMAFTAVSLVLSILFFIVLCFTGKSPSGLLLLPIILPVLPMFFFIYSSLGVFESAASGKDSLMWLFNSLHGATITIMSLIALVAFVATLLYVALRATARQMYDPAYSDWKQSWKAPAAFGIFWLLAVPLFLTVDSKVGVSGILTNVLGKNGGSFSASFHPAYWYFIMPMIWAFLVEIVPRTFGPGLIYLMKSLWPFLRNGCVTPTPQVVLAYSRETNAPAAGSGQGATGTNPNSQATGGQTPNPAFPAGGNPAFVGTQTPGGPGPVAGTPANAAGQAGQGLPTSDGEHPDGHMPAEDREATTAQTSQMAQGGNAGSGSGDGWTSSISSAAALPTFPPDTANETQTFQAVSGQVQVTGQPAFPGDDPFGQAKPRKPLSGKQKTTIFTVLALVVLCIVLGIAYAILNSTVFNPQKVADEYINAIATSQYDQASRMSDPQVPQNQQELVSDKAAAKDKTMIGNQRVTSTDTRKDGSTVFTYTYTISGKETRDSITVIPSGKRFLIFNDWKVSTPLLKEVDFRVPQMVPMVNVNGIPVNLGDNQSDDSSSSSYREVKLKVYPGSYTVSLPESKFLQGSELTVTTGSKSGDQVIPNTLKVTPKDTLENAINEEIKKKVDACVSSKDPDEKACGFSKNDIFTFSDIRNLTWSVDQYPEISRLSLDDPQFFTTGGRLKAQYEDKSFDDQWKKEDQTLYIAYQGSYTVNGDKVEVSFETR